MTFATSTPQFWDPARGRYFVPLFPRARPVWLCGYALNFGTPLGVVISFRYFQEPGQYGCVAMLCGYVIMWLCAYVWLCGFSKLCVNFLVEGCLCLGPMWYLWLLRNPVSSTDTYALSKVEHCGALRIRRWCFRKGAYPAPAHINSPDFSVHETRIWTGI